MVLCGVCNKSVAEDMTKPFEDKVACLDCILERFANISSYLNYQANYQTGQGQKTRQPFTVHLSFDAEARWATFKQRGELASRKLAQSRMKLPDLISDKYQDYRPQSLKDARSWAPLARDEWVTTMSLTEGELDTIWDFSKAHDVDPPLTRQGHYSMAQLISTYVEAILRGYLRLSEPGQPELGHGRGTEVQDATGDRTGTASGSEVEQL